MAQVKLDGVEVPAELLELLARSRLSTLDTAGQIRNALAIHLFIVGEISLGRAAQLAGEPRAAFARLLKELGVPIVQYGMDQYEEDLQTIQALERQDQSA
jgi:predicted HTH domain antitoxin